MAVLQSVQSVIVPKNSGRSFVVKKGQTLAQIRRWVSRPTGSTGIGRLVQGYTEASNVDAVSEITALIVAQRAYEMNSKVISTADTMLGVANQLKS